MLLILFGVAVLTNQAFAAGKCKFITRIRHRSVQRLLPYVFIYVQLINLSYTYILI